MKRPPPRAVRQLLSVAGLALTLPVGAIAQAGPSASATQPAAAATGPLFAVEIRTGPAWDHGKPAQEQAHFREHSAHLRRLREQGALVMGARYADKGLVVLRAASESEAHALLKDDPSIQAGVFRYELHEFRVFYSGNLTAPSRPR